MSPKTAVLSSLAFAIVAMSYILAPDYRKAQELRLSIATELHEGADPETVESFLKRHGITYSFDGYQSRYQGIIRNISKFLDQAVVVYIYMDDKKRFKRAEVENSYTFM